MLNQTLKKKIFKIMPEHNLLMKKIKKVYGVFLLLQSFSILIYQKFLFLLFKIRGFLFLKKPIRARINNTYFKIIPRGKDTFKYWSGIESEEQKVKFVFNQIKPGMTFFDIGAKTGLISLALASKYKDIKIYAFEPRKEIFHILEKNIKLNRFSNSIILQKEVPELDNYSIGQIDLMKVDIQGKELFLFQGAKNLLSRLDAPIILYQSSESHTKEFGYHPIETMWLLQDFGYSFYVLGDGGKIIPRRPREYDAIIIAIKS